MRRLFPSTTTQIFILTLFLPYERVGSCIIVEKYVKPRFIIGVFFNRINGRLGTLMFHNKADRNYF